MDDPITLWIEELRGEDEAAATKLWNHFFLRLYEAARRKLRPDSRRLYDEEDAALSAFNCVCEGIAAGRFPELRDRESLLRLLLVITARKVSRRHRHDQRQRRDVRRTSSHSIFVDGAEDSALAGIHQIPSREPTPEFALAFAETCDSLFQSLDDPKLQKIAALRMEGYTDSEIATRLNCARSTVQRRLEIIRRECQQLEESAEA
jgi:DNA-directed RNA polymerase specialized sigma24 family protein